MAGVITEAPEVVPPAREPAHAATTPAAVMAVAVPAACAAVLAMLDVTSRSLGFDEGATVSIASQHGAALWHAIARDGGNMSGYYLLMHALIGTFGNGLLVLRLPSVVAFAATAALIAMIARRLFDDGIALVAGVLAAVSLPLVYWAQTARGYAPMLALVCAGTLAFIALADPRDGATPGWRPWLGYVVAMTLAMYFSFVAVLVVPAQLLVVVHRRGALVRLLTALAAIAAGAVPLAVLALRRGSGQLFWVPRPTRMVETQVLDSLTSAGLQPSVRHTATTSVLLWGTVAAVVALLAAAAVRRARHRDRDWARTLVLAYCVVPAALTFVYSLVMQPIFVPRNLLISTPAVALAFAPVICDRRLPRWAAAVLLLVVLSLRTMQVGAAYGVSPEPWQQVTDHVLAAARPGDCIAFYPEDGRMAFQYYVGTAASRTARAPRSILPVRRWGTVRPYVEDYATLSSRTLGRRARGCRRMWFIASHEGQRDGPLQSRINRARYEALGAELAARFGAAPPVNEGYASTIHVQLLPGTGSPAAAGVAHRP